MASSEMQQAQVRGITYRTDDFSHVVVLCGDKAIYRSGDGTSFVAERMVDIERAWVVIARHGLKLVSSL